MGVWDDLLYFGPSLGPRRGLTLLARKIQKESAKKKTASELRREESDTSLLERLRLDPGQELRVEELRKMWGPLVALSVAAKDSDARELDERAQAVLA